MSLRLSPGPRLSHQSSSTDPWTDVTQVAHRYLFEPITLDPDVVSADLLRLVDSSPTLLDVFERWNARTYLIRNNFGQVWDDYDAMILAKAKSAEVILLGQLLDSLLFEVTFFGSHENALDLAGQITQQEFSEAISSEEMIEELDQMSGNRGTQQRDAGS